MAKGAVVCEFYNYESINIKPENKRRTVSKQQNNKLRNSAERKGTRVFALSLYLDFKFVTIFKQHDKDARIFRSKSTIDHNRYLANGEILYILIVYYLGNCETYSLS